MVLGYRVRCKHMGSYTKSALHIEVPNQMLGLSEEEAGIWMQNELLLLFFLSVLTTCR